MTGESKLTKEMTECYTQVPAGQHLEDGPLRSANQYGNLQTAIPTVSTGPEPTRYGAGASTMPISASSTGWSGSPYSSSASIRSIPPPSPTSSPSGSSYAASVQQNAPYRQTSEYTPPVPQSAGYEGLRTGYLKAPQRPETPGMESRPQTASSYDSGLNFAIQGRHAETMDTQYGRHSSAPVTLSSGQTINVQGAPHAQSSLYMSTSGPTYSTPSSSTTVHYRESPPMGL